MIVGMESNFSLLLLTGYRTMARLRQLGGFFSLVSWEDGRLMYVRRNFRCEDSSIIDGVMTNDAHVCGLLEDDDKENRTQLLEDACTVELCKTMIDFLIVTRDEFDGIDTERKRQLFGKEFKNLDCPSVVNVCFRCCTIGQTFNDDFSLTKHRGIGYLEPLTLIKGVISPCLLSKVHLLMMCFIHKFVQSNYFVRLSVKASDMHCWIGESVFFHDRLIDLFMDECEDPSENGMMDRDDIYIIFDRRNVNNLMSFRLCVFIYVGKYLDSDFCDQLEKIRRENFFPRRMQ